MSQTYVSALIVIIQDRVNYLEGIKMQYPESERGEVIEEIITLENVLNILVGLS